MKLSIVTISYNQGRYLEACLKSVLSQTNVDVEYIVVDAGSTDLSRAIITRYAHRLTPIFEADNGPADGLNKGFSRATGDVFGFLNADDYLLPGALSGIATFFRRCGKTQFVSGGGFIEHPDKGLIRVVPTTMRRRSYVYGACTVFQQGTFFPAEFFRAVGGFNTKNRTCWDGELFGKFLFAGYRHCVLKGDFAVFRIHPDSISGSKRALDQYRLDQDRIFRDLVGRPRGRADKIAGILARGGKLIKGRLQRLSR